MKKKYEKAGIPRTAGETERRMLIGALRQGPRTAKELSAEVGLPEKDVYDHLEHVRRSLTTPELRLAVTPAECKKCGFVFAKRERLRKPGRCPVCKGESIRDPLFSVE